MFEMEAPRYAYVTDPASHQPELLSCRRGPSSQGLSHPRQPSVFEPQTVYLKAVPVPLYHLFQPPDQQAAGGQGPNVESSSVPMILSPIVHSEKTELAPAVIQKQQGQTLTLNIVGTLPMLSSGFCSGSSIGSPGKSKNAGKYICEHCRRDCLKPSVLEKHIRSHTGERPFPCTTCGIAFKTQSNLYKHRRTQTHVNNARLSSESDSSILEESEKVLEASGQQPLTEREGQFNERGGHLSERGGHLSERGGHLSKRGSHLSECQGLHNKEMCPEMDSILEDTSSTTAPASSLVSRCRKVTYGDPKGQKETAHVDPINPGDPLLDPQKVPSTTGVPPVLHVKKKLQEQRPLTTTRQVQLQRQQATYSEKQLEFTASEQKLKKCESTDSGYLSHSDSVDQQMWSCSPLHSLCEQSSEAEHEPNGSSLGDTALNISQLQLIEKTSSLPREKKNLEEHISKLISQNTKVVDKTQLDTVRPRKTALSKQGSIDVLTPYTYKDSFHFDIKSLGGNRKNNFSLGSAKSTFTPLEKSKPLFFHSIPTQFSTTVDCVPVKRSHSLPFVENTGNLQEQAVNSKLSRMTHQPLDVRFSSLLHSGQCAANVTHCHNSHPRALVRQSAVDHLPSTHTADYSGGLDSKDGRGTAGHAPGTRCPTAGKKGSQRKLKMFSQEKWQMYGDDTFKKIYQKKHCEITKKLKHDKESHLNDLTSLVSDLQVAGSRGGFTQQTHASAPAPSPVGGSLKPKQSDGCLCDGQVASQQTAQGSIRGLTEASQPTNPTVRTRRSKTVSVQGHTSIPSPALRESSGGSPLSLNSRATWTPQVQQVTGQPSTSLTRPETRTQQGLDVQHYSLAALTTPNLPGLGCARSTYSDGERNNKAVHQQGKAIVRLGESSCGASSSAESSEEVGRLPSEKKKLKVEELGQINDLPFKLSTSNTKNAGDSDDTVTGRHWYTGPDQVESSNYPVVEEQEDVDGDAGGLEGTASEKTLGRPSESPDADHSKPSLDGASVSLSTVYCTPQGPQNTGKRDLILEKHQNRPASSKCTVLGKNSLQALICTPSTTPQWLMQTTSVIHDSFSPKYLLKLPAAEAPGDPQATPATGEELLSPSLSVTITEDALRLVSKAHRAESVVASVFSLSLQTEPTQQSVIVEPAAGVPAQQGTFLPDLPSTSTVSIATCIAYHCHGKSSTHQDITRDIRAQRDGSEERKPKMKAATTNIDSLAHTTSEILSCEPADTGDLLLSSENERHHLHTADGPFLATTSILHAGKPSGTNQEESAEGWEPCHTWSCSPKGPPRDPQNSREHPKTSGGNSSDPFPRPAGSVCHTVTTQQRGGSALPRKGLSFHSGSKSIAATDVSFPCLNTELHMNWCCLARSLPCTVGQKEDTYSSSSLHAFRDHPAMGRPGLRCRVSVLDMMHASACLASTTTTEGVKAPASLTSYAEQKNKVDLATIRTSTKTSGQIMKTEASCKNEDTTVNTTNESKKAKITKKG